MGSFDRDAAKYYPSYTGEEDILCGGFTIPLETWKSIEETKTVTEEQLSKHIGLMNLQRGDLIALFTTEPYKNTLQKTSELFSDSIYRVLGLDFEANNDSVEFTLLLSESGTKNIVSIKFDEGDTETGIWSGGDHVYDRLPPASLVSDRTIAEKFNLNEELVKNYL